MHTESITPDEEVNVPLATDNSTLFGTSSSDILEGLHKNSFVAAEEQGLPEDDEQIVNEEDQQEIVNVPEEELSKPAHEPEVTTLENIPGAEKDLFDKNILEEREVPGEEDTSGIKAT